MSSNLPNSRSAALAPVLAAAGVLVSVLGVLLAYLGVVPPLVGFAMFALGLVAGAALGVLVGALGVFRTGFGRKKNGFRQALVGLGVGIALILGLMLLMPPSDIPPIHDITTSPDDPPVFVDAAVAPGNLGRDLTYPHGGAEVSRQQRTAYPDLAPLELSSAPDATFAAVRAAVDELGWEILGESAGEGRLEATDTSSVFRFVDDVVIRVRPRDAGSVVDVRSTSRVGQSDLGANAARIRDLLDRIR